LKGSRAGLAVPGGQVGPPSGWADLRKKVRSGKEWSSLRWAAH